VNERTHLDLFSGIGGFALAAKWNGFRTVAFCDCEPYAQAVLKKHWPDVHVHGDIREVRGELYAGVTLLTGGFPCQPFSVAGKQRGKTDDRYLWPEMLRVIREARPAWIVGENVAGIVNMALDQVHADLEAEGYEVESLIIPACAVDAPHRRDRVWIVAHSKYNGQSPGAERRGVKEAARIKSQGAHESLNSQGAGLLSAPEYDVEDSSRKQLEECLNPRGEEGTHFEPSGSSQGVSASKNVAHSESVGIQRLRASWIQESHSYDCEGLSLRQNQGSQHSQWLPEPDVGRVAHGISNRTHRLKGLGNAIVPQVAAEIIRCIVQVSK